MSNIKNQSLKTFDTVGPIVLIECDVSGSMFENSEERRGKRPKNIKTFPELCISNENTNTLQTHGYKKLKPYSILCFCFVSGYSMSDLHSSTLTPMHLRKAKLMFFWTRYPSSAILKMYFPDIKFNKNNTAQLVKWFSNFR